MTSLAKKYLIWECCPTWVRLKTLLFGIVTDPFAELTITLCIVVNTVFMAMEHHRMSPAFEAMLQIGNIVSDWQPSPSCHGRALWVGWPHTLIHWSVDPASRGAVLAMCAH